MRGRKYPIGDRWGSPSNEFVQGDERSYEVYAVLAEQEERDCSWKRTCIEAVIEVDVSSRGKRYSIAADAGTERVKPLITRGHVWSHRGCYNRTTGLALARMCDLIATYMSICVSCLDQRVIN